MHIPVTLINAVRNCNALFCKLTGVEEWAAMLDRYCMEGEKALESILVAKLKE